MKNKPKGVKRVEVKAWAWIDLRFEGFPICSIDETKEIVAEEKRKFLNPENKEVGKVLRSLYRKSKVVPCTISFTPTSK